MNSEELQFLPVSNDEGQALPIAFRFAQPGVGRPTFIWFSGFKSDMGSVKAEALSDWCRKNSAGCLRFDYSGHGQSGGRFEDGTITRWLRQAVKVSRLAVERGPTVFVGSSMGAWIALLLSKEFAQTAVAPPRGLALIAPAWDMTRLMLAGATEEARAAIARNGVYLRPSRYGDGPYPITRALLEDGERHIFGPGPLAISTSIRIIHGQQDVDVPWRHSLDLMDVVACSDVRLTLIKDGEHRLSRPQDLALLFSTLAEFL
jgi:pimeloyl-ACP methyl ester carboxylesterase